MSEERTMIVTARLQFAAAHRLHNEAFDDEWNRRVFDKCDNPAGHGHNYTIEVSVSGPVDPDTGMVIDLKRLKTIMRDRIVDKVDHKNLNLDVEFLRGINPTAENLAMRFWEQLEDAVAPCKLEQIVLRETEKNSVTYRG